MMKTSALRKHMDFSRIMSKVLLFIFALGLLTVSNCSVVRAEDGYLEAWKNEQRIFYLYIPYGEKREYYSKDNMFGWLKQEI